MPRVMRTAAALLLATLACCARAPRAAASSSQPPLAAAAEFVPPQGYSSFADYCARGLSWLSDAALDALYEDSRTVASTPASNNASAAMASAALAAPRGCVPGCILAGHGTALTAPLVRGWLWSGKCFYSDGRVVNFSADVAPSLTGNVRAPAARNALRCCAHAAC
jgi:hypothetical protein